MMSIRNKTVNVNRIQLIVKIKEGMTQHQAQYQEAVVDYQTRLQYELKDLLDAITTADPTSDVVLKAKINFNTPQSHVDQYAEAIEMLEFSVDEHINLDDESFRAYVKNQWSWSNSFEQTFFGNKAYISGKVGSAV